MSIAPFTWRAGGCHCGGVRFEVALPAEVEAQTCNCSICAECGVKSFYRPRSNPNGCSVNARCLDDLGGVTLQVEPFDGRNWEAHAGSLAHLSEAP